MRYLFYVAQGYRHNTTEARTVAEVMHSSACGLLITIDVGLSHLHIPDGQARGPPATRRYLRHGPQRVPERGAQALHVAGGAAAAGDVRLAPPDLRRQLRAELGGLGGTRTKFYSYMCFFKLFSCKLYSKVPLNGLIEINNSTLTTSMRQRQRCFLHSARTLELVFPKYEDRHTHLSVLLQSDVIVCNFAYLAPP